MPTRFARKHGFSLAALLLVGIGALVVSAALHFKSDRRWVDHTHRVLTTLADIDLLEEQVVTAARGMVLFNRDSYYQQYVQADGALREHLVVLRSLVADNPGQSRRALNLQEAMLRRLDYPRIGIETFRRSGVESLRNRDAEMANVAEAQAEVQAILTAMKAEETELLRGRAREANRAFNRLGLAAVLGIPFCLAVLGWVFRQLSHEIKQRRATEARLDLANQELTEMAERLRQESLTDPLTGLYNRRYVTEATVREIARCVRRKLPLSILALDIDHFRQFNSQYGHAGGDEVLKAVADVLRCFSRREDIACRLGGEEFALVLPEAGADAAREKAELIRRELSSLSVEVDGALMESVTVSVGLAVMPEDGVTPEELMRTADVRLYRAKNAGRNRVVSD